jgi:lipopolysaccharide biosynthesis protein
MRRICLFSFYDEQGLVDDYVVFLLKELGRFVEKIIFFSNGPLSKEGEIALRGVVHEVVLRPNEGFDVLAYKEGLEKIEFDRAGRYDEVLMVNHTCYGPVYPFAELFEEMSTRECDFWGITAHLEMTPNPFTGHGKLPYHLNTNFVAVRGDMLRSQTFRQYWERLQGSKTYEEAILSHEAVFTEYFTKLGYVCETYLDNARYGTHYPAILGIDETLIDRSPLVKRRALFHDPRFLEHYSADVPRALHILEQTSDYDRSMIWRNIVRSAELRTLNTNGALTSVLPDVRIKQSDTPASCGRIALCVHVYYTEMLDEILALADTIPCEYDFVATTETQAKKEIIEKTVSGRKNVGEVIVRVVEQNRGRDMSALFISCRDLFVGDRYELVCRLHTKKTPHLAGGRSNIFKRHMFENLLNSPGYTSNVIDMFHDNPWIGMAIPPVIQYSYGTLGHSWYGNLPAAEKLTKLLDLSVQFDTDTPVAPYGGMFWFRPKALRKLFAHRWKWTDFEPEPYPLEGTLGHALERLMCYVAQDARYTTQQVLSSRHASWGYAVLEYKLQKLSALLPNGEFNYQCTLMEQWKSAAYPLTPSSGDRPALSPQVGAPSSVRHAFGELLRATKRSIAFRSPRVANVLRPIYRGTIRRR